MNLNSLKSLKRVFLRKFRNLRYKLNPHRYEPSFWIGLATRHKIGQVVQIGSNDGKADDPLHQLITKNEQWQAHFIEPVDDAFERLKANYGNNERFNFHQIAINDGSTQLFYYVSPEAEKSVGNLPKHYNKLGSFLRSNIVTHLGKEIEPYIRQKEIAGLSLPQFFRKNDIDTPLILHTDTEGYDWEILKQLDLRQNTPTVVLFEHKHLFVNDKNSALNHFRATYDMFRFGQDVLCIKTGTHNKFSKKQQQTLNRNRINLFLTA